MIKAATFLVSVLVLASAGPARAAGEHMQPHGSPKIDDSALLKADSRDASDNSRDWSKAPTDELARESTRHAAVVYAAAVDAATNAWMLAQVTAEPGLTNEPHSRPLALVAGRRCRWRSSTCGRCEA